MLTRGSDRKPILKTVARMALGGDDVLVESFMDITELKRVERSLSEHVHLLQSVMDAVPAPVFYKDCEGRYRGCNGAFLQLIGRKQAEVIGHTVAELAVEDLAKYDGSETWSFWPRPAPRSTKRRCAVPTATAVRWCSTRRPTMTPTATSPDLSA